MKQDLDAIPHSSGHRFRSPWFQDRGAFAISTVSLFTTLLISFLTLRQVTTHFKIERTSAFLSRFNAADFIQARESADRWFETNEKPEDLYQRSNAVPAASPDPKAVALIQNLRLLANFFQEFGSSIKHRTLDDKYAWELLGVTSYAYADKLTPFICESRRRDEATGHHEAHTYGEVFWLEKWVAQNARSPKLLPARKWKPKSPLTPSSTKPGQALSPPPSAKPTP